MKNSRVWLVLVWGVFTLGGCSSRESGEASPSAGSQAAADQRDARSSEGREPPPQKAATKTSSKVLLVAESTFRRNEKGLYTEPNGARLYVLRREGNRWSREVIRDTESEVFHKGMILNDCGEGSAPAIITAGAKQASLKLWRRGESGWQSETIWAPSFGGTLDRLRDMEIGDVTGDGQLDIVIATHDQGVVSVIRRTSKGWEPTEVDRAAGIWVHEVEIGDVDGDGTQEIYATPSFPNKSAGGPQPGKVTRYRWTGEGFERDIAAEWPNRHAKEIMVTDLDGNTRPELYAALEGETEGGLCGMPGTKILEATKIVRIDHGDSGWSSKVVATIPDECLCRFLVAGDLDGDNQSELIAAAFKRGIWMYEHGESLPFQGRQLEKATGGFEHATLLADYDGDGSPELFVADDNNGRVLRFTWNDGNLSEPEILMSRTVPQSAITWNLWVAEFPDS